MYNALSVILNDYTGERLQAVADDLLPSEYCANQMLLAMPDIQDAKDIRRDRRLADAIAKQHDCEVSWWYALYTNCNRSHKVMQTRRLIYGKRSELPGPPDQQPIQACLLVPRNRFRTNARPRIATVP